MTDTQEEEEEEEEEGVYSKLTHMSASLPFGKRDAAIGASISPIRLASPDT